MWKNWDAGYNTIHSRTTILVTSMIRLRNLGTTIFTSKIFVAIEGRHVGNEGLTEYSEINIKKKEPERNNARELMAKNM